MTPSDPILLEDLLYRRFSRNSGERSGCNVTSASGRTGMWIGQLDLELPHEAGENQHRFGQRELRPDAGPRSGPERQIGKPRRRFGLRQKPLRPEQIGVAPQFFVAVQHPGHDQHDRAGRDRVCRRHRHSRRAWRMIEKAGG